MKLADTVGLVSCRIKAQGYGVVVNQRLGYLVFSDSKGADLFIQGVDFNIILSKVEKLENGLNLPRLNSDDIWLFVLEPYAALFEDQ